jgi:ATP-dependent RNA helicase HelY
MASSTPGESVRAETRARFEASVSFALDPFQIEAIDALDAGASVVVAAPTGSGKTIVAEYAIAQAIASGKRAYYTAPIKALSNQKYRDLLEVHGPAQVGLLTGDTSINDTAPIVVMTTEVLRNMIHAGNRSLDDLRYVIMDEVHFLQDTYRGPVWEEVIISTPPEVDLVCLSATVSNAHALADWVSSVRGTTRAIVHTERPVELTHLHLVGHRGSHDVDVYETFAQGRPNPKLQRLDARADDRTHAGRHQRSGGGPNGVVTPRRIDVVNMLHYEDLLPAIYFIFSRASCDEAMRNCLHGGVRLTHPEERAEIRSIVDAKVAGLSRSDLEALDFQTFLAGIENGVTSHHAGLVPPFKEAVEACFTLGLVKVVFATETLALGINMPARTVVIEKLSKYNGAGNSVLTAGEFTQLTGRAGRRGLDPHGYAATLWSPYMAFDDVAELANRRSYELRSAFRPTYNMAANLISRSTREQAEHFLRLSFAQYQIDAQLVRSNASAHRIERELVASRHAAECEHGDVRAYLARAARTGNRAARRAAKASSNPSDQREQPLDLVGATRVLSSAQPGTVLRFVPADSGSSDVQTVVVMSTANRGPDRVTLRVLTIDGESLTITPESLSTFPTIAGHVSVPVPYNPQSKHFRKQLTSNLARSVAGRHIVGRGGVAVTTARQSRDTASGELQEHDPLASCPDFQAHLAAIRTIDRLEAELRRTRRASEVRSTSLVDQLNRVLELLDRMNCRSGWELTESGVTLAGIFHECDLLIADCVRGGLFDGLRPAEMAALASVFVYEQRGPGRGAEGLPRAFPAGLVDRWWRVVHRAERLNGLESSLELPLTRSPDPGFAAIAYGWARGRDLNALLAQDDITGGDLVRTMKALIDLLRQLGEVAPDPDTKASAKAAATQLFRGVVAASSTVSDDEGQADEGQADEGQADEGQADEGQADDQPGL